MNMTNPAEKFGMSKKQYEEINDLANRVLSKPLDPTKMENRPAEKIRQVVEEGTNKIWEESADGSLYMDDTVIICTDAIRIQQEALAAQLDAITEEMERRNVDLARERDTFPKESHMYHWCNTAYIHRDSDIIFLKEARTSITNTNETKES